MEIREVTDSKYREEWNGLAGHPLQAWEWGEFREQTGVKVARYGIFESGEKTSPLREILQVTIHPIPHTKWTIGYFPKGNELTKQQTITLTEIARKYNCIFIKCEPKQEKSEIRNPRYEKWMKDAAYVAGRPLFTKYNFVLDVSKSEEELLKGMKQKTRYNIRVAEKRGVKVEIDNSNEAFEKYLELTEETTKRQGFYAHSADYHRKLWEIIGKSEIRNQKSELTANLLVARYNNEIITTWVLFQFGDTLYYPYGASSREHREVMANNLVMWEAIKLAKKWNLKYLDMWGALGPDADPQDPWYGFHTFKLGYGARQVEYVGTWDWVAKPIIYRVYRLIESVRWKILRLMK